MKQLVLLFLIFSSAVVVSSCKSEARIPIDKMKMVFWELALVDEYTGYYVKIDTLRNLDSAINSSYYRVLKMHDISKDEFNSEIEFYTKNPDKYRILMDSVTNYANRQREKGYQRRYKSDPISIDEESMNQ